MSRLVGLLILTVANVAVADAPADAPADPPAAEPAPAKVDAKPAAPSKLRLVRVMMDSEQALLFDKVRGRYIAVETGDTVAGYTVERIDEDEVTLSGKSGQLLLVVGEPSKPPAKAAKPEPAADVTPEDPYGDDEEAGAPREVSAPLDTTGETRTISATPGAPREVEAPKAPATEAAPKAPAPAAKPKRDAVDALLELQAEAARDAELEELKNASAKTTATLSRKEIDAALRDFGALVNAVHGAFTADGVRLDRVAAGSVFAKAGLRAGDMIVAVDGKPVRSLDDAADLYVAASAARAFSIKLQRGGKPVALQLNIK